MKHAVAAVALVALVACGDDDGAPTLLVDLQTDLRPGVELAAIDLSARSGDIERRASAPAVATDDFTRGRRVAELQGLTPGPVTLSVVLRDATGLSIAQRSVELTLSGVVGTTVVITRDCYMARCPAAGDPPSATACHGGRCVSPTCTPTNAGACGDPECGSEDDCGPAPACVDPRCVAGACVMAAVDERCGPGGSCDPRRGCDGAAFDAGPSLGCAERTLEPQLEPSCTAATGACLAACTDSECATTCLTSDPTPEGACYGCYLRNTAACANERGCQSLYECYAECLSPFCADPFAPDCSPPGASCLGESDAYVECINTVSLGCSDVVAACFD